MDYRNQAVSFGLIVGVVPCSVKGDMGSVTRVLVMLWVVVVILMVLQGALPVVLL